MNEIAELRTALYQYLSKLVDYPYDDDVKNMNDCVSHMISIAEHLEQRSDIYKGISETARGAKLIIQDIERLGSDHFQAEYVSAFELGQPKAPCPLYSREYPPYAGREDDLELLNEITKIYDQFGVEIQNETPDFLPVELEFIAFLIQKKEEEKESEKYLKAQLDFMDTYLLWLNHLHELVKKRCKLPGYVKLFETVYDFVDKDRQFLNS